MNAPDTVGELSPSVRESRRNLLWAFAMLTLITWVLGILLPHHVPFSSQTPILESLPGTSDDWKFSGEPCDVQLTENELVFSRSTLGTSRANLHWRRVPLNDGNESSIEISGHVKCRLPKVKNLKRVRGVLFVSQRDSTNKNIKRTLIRVFKAKGGDGNWSIVLRPKKETKTIVFTAGLLVCTGEMLLSDLKFQFVESYLPFQLVFVVLSFAWSVFGIYVVIHFFKSGHVRSLWLPAIFIGMIVVGISLPAGTIYRLSRPIDKFITGFHEEYPDSMLFWYEATQLGHVICFAAFSLIALLLRKRLHISNYELAAVFGLLVLSSEGMQLFLSDRSANLTDMVMDLAGIMIGCLAFAIICSIKRVGRVLMTNGANQESADPSAGGEAAPEASK